MSGLLLIVEDHPLYRDALTRLALRAAGDSLKVVSCASAEEGIRIAGDSREPVQLVLIDIGLPGMSGAEALMRFRAINPSARIVAVSGTEDRREVDAVLRAGAAAFVSKSVSAEEITAVIRRALDNKLEQPEWVNSYDNGPLHDQPALGLSRRQLEILLLLGYGLSNKEIGLRLGRAEVTVKQHLSAIFRVLGVANRTQAVLEARRIGLQTGSAAGLEAAQEED